MKITIKEKKEFRNKLLREQKGICPLCSTTITEEEATLDHDHGTGQIRMALHRSCNQVEGRILSWIKRSRGEDPLKFLEALVQYWKKDYSDMPTHPQHKNTQEKKVATLKRKLKILKSEKGKNRCLAQIKNLLNTCNP